MIRSADRSEKTISILLGMRVGIAARVIVRQVRSYLASIALKACVKRATAWVVSTLSFRNYWYPMTAYPFAKGPLSFLVNGETSDVTAGISTEMRENL